MNHQFWLERWASDRIGFHKTEVNPALVQYWNTLELRSNSRILVPLCGKSLDLLWLHKQGHSVLGIDLSEKAILAFFRENELTYTVQKSGKHTQFIGTDAAEGITLICGDILSLSSALTGKCDGIYDRAAMIALPPEMRAKYGFAVGNLLVANACGLLLTLCYPASEKEGPPFSVPSPKYGDNTGFELLESTDLLADPNTAKRYSLSAISENIYAVTFEGEMT